MAQKKDDRFEMSKLMELGEPLTVYLERIVGSTTEPIALPALGRDRNIDLTGTPGTGWTRDDVVKLMPWVKDFWSGAGTYRTQVVSQEKKVLEWEFSIPLSDTVKQRTPPPLGQPGAVPPSAIQQVQLTPAPQPQNAVAVQPPPAMPGQGWGGPQQVPMSGPWTPPQNTQVNPWGQPAAPPQQMPMVGPWGQQPMQFQQPVQGPYGPMSPYNPYAPPPWQQQPPWAQPGGPARDSETEKALKAVQAQLEESKRREIQLKYEQDLERQRQDNQRQIDALKEEIRRANEKSNSKESDEIVRLREERDRAEREQERRDTAARFETLAKSISELAAGRHSTSEEALRRLDEENRRRDEKRDEEHRREIERRDAKERDERLLREMKESEAKHERTIAEIRAQASKGPDPVLELMKESQRQALQTQERIAQMQSSQYQALQQSTINPMQLLTILEKRDSSGDQFIRNMMPALTGVIELYRGAAENVVGLAGGGPAAAWQPVAEQVISSGKEIMDRYFQFKRDSEVSGNKAKIAQAEAQKEAASAAAQAQVAMASMQAQQARASANGHAGLNGAAVTAGPPPAKSTAAPAQEAQGNVVPLRTPPSEVERFGKALESVKRLREGVKNGKLDPNQAIDAIMQGVNFVSMHNSKHPPGDPDHLVVPVFTLYQEERWADFIDQLLPDAPLPFKDECVRILVEDTEPDDGQEQKDPDVTV